MKVQARVKRNPAIFMMLLFVLLALPLPLFAETAFKIVSTDELKAMLAEGKPLTLIDSRSPGIPRGAYQRGYQHPGKRASGKRDASPRGQIRSAGNLLQRRKVWQKQATGPADRASGIYECPDLQRGDSRMGRAYASYRSRPGVRQED